MNEHPIESLMEIAMNNIQDMVDVNTIIGDPIEITNNIVIIPISKVSFGFAAGGSEFNKGTMDEYTKKDKDDEEIKYKLPFGGGSGAGVSINPIAFIVVQERNVKLLPVSHLSTIDRLLDYVPDIFEKIENKMENKETNKKAEKTINEILKEENKESKKKVKPQTEKEEYEIEYQEDEDLDD